MSRIVIDARELRTSTGRYIERLLHYLQQIDNEHRYIVLLKPKDMEGWKPSNRRFQKVACPFKEFTFAEQIGFLRQLNKLKADLVHFGMTHQPVLYRGAVITTMHDLTGLRFRNPTKNWFIFTVKQFIYKWVNYYVAHKSKEIITPSEFVKDDVAKFAGINSRKITVTYEAADQITDAPEVVEGLEDRQFVMYVGRPTPHKNLNRLVEAFALVKQQYPDLHLVLVGKLDKNYKLLKSYVRKLAVEDVIFTDFVSEGQLRWLYENTAAYIFPSLSEGFGLPGLEAMMHGAPVVSSNATCLPEVYQDGALYFDPLDVQDMADKISKVLGSPKLADDLRAKGAKVVKSYSWKRMAEQTLEVYNRVLSS